MLNRHDVPNIERCRKLAKVPGLSDLEPAGWWVRRWKLRPEVVVPETGYPSSSYTVIAPAYTLGQLWAWAAKQWEGEVELLSTDKGPTYAEISVPTGLGWTACWAEHRRAPNAMADAILEAVKADPTKGEDDA